MEDETQVIEETLDTQDTVEETPEETVEEIKARLAKAEELANNYKIRAEKAEKKAKDGEPQTTNTLSAVDLLAVSKAGIEPEDLDDIVEYAKFKNIPLHEALKSTVIKATLAEKNELRKSADATNTSSARRGNATVSDDRLLADAAKGDLPDSEDDLKRLIALRHKARRG